MSRKRIGPIIICFALILYFLWALSWMTLTIFSNSVFTNPDPYKMSILRALTILSLGVLLTVAAIFLRNKKLSFKIGLCFGILHLFFIARILLTSLMVKTATGGGFEWMLALWVDFPIFPITLICAILGFLLDLILHTEAVFVNYCFIGSFLIFGTAFIAYLPVIFSGILRRINNSNPVSE